MHRAGIAALLSLALSAAGAAADDPPARRDRRRGHLQPATGPTTDVEDPLAGSQQPLGPLDLGELVGRTRAIALALGPLVEGIAPLVGHSRGRPTGPTPSAQMGARSEPEASSVKGSAGGERAQALAVRAGRMRTRPLLWPGTAPRIRTRFFSVSTRTTSRLRVVTRSLPMRPDIFMPLMTLPG